MGGGGKQSHLAPDVDAVLDETAAAGQGLGVRVDDPHLHPQVQTGRTARRGLQRQAGR